MAIVPATVSSSERRCGECGHSEGTGADGFCQHFEVKSRNSGSRCLCKCVFPGTGVLAQARHRVDVKANVDWLKANAQNFAGEWVAIRNGVLLDVDKSHSALLKRIGPTKGTDILVTWAYDPATGATTEHEEAVRDHGTDTTFQSAIALTGVGEGRQRDIWDSLNQRRAELIDAVRSRLLTGEETADLIALQRVAGLVRELVADHPFEVNNNSPAVTEVDPKV